MAAWRIGLLWVLALGLIGAPLAGAVTARAPSPAEPSPAPAAAIPPAPAASGRPSAGELDCNGFSPVQEPLRPMACTDVRGFVGTDNPNTWGGRFYDNGVYIGHDEPSVTFLSSRPGSGDNASWNFSLGQDPAANPTVGQPGADVAHWFELTPAIWFAMALCDPWSYPQLPCTPGSDANAANGSYPGGGSAFLELQFYPPGFAPFADAIGCDNTHWCAALTIDSLECTDAFSVCNPNCVEPVNFAFVQTNGVPTGPPSPQGIALASELPNAQTLLMDPGDRLSVHLFDAPVAGQPGQHALEAVVDDLTLGITGSMQASAANGFAHTSITDCSGAPFDFEPEYATAGRGHIVPWAALQADIGAAVETGHFEPCTSLAGALPSNPFDPADAGGTYSTCAGPYENASAPDGSNSSETSDAPCYAAGDTHTNFDGAGGTTAPNLVTGCTTSLAQNGDLDFDGTPYWTEWPLGNATTAALPGSFALSFPTSGGVPFPAFFAQTDVALSESGCNALSGSGCGVPPPTAPGAFYPYWSEVRSGGQCSLEFGNVGTGAGVNDLGQDQEYGTDQGPVLGYPEFEGPRLSNPCAPPPPAYSVAFTESGLPAGTTWSVTLHGQTLSSAGSLIQFSEPNGSYSYSIAPVPGYATLLSGQITVNGLGLTRAVAFSAVAYAVDFTETGLPAGTLWAVTLGGSTNASSTASLAFSMANGTYSFRATAPGYRATPAAGSVEVNGSGASETVRFAAVQYGVSFTESGLPPGTTWSATLNGVARSSSATTLSFDEPNASYAFAVTAVPGYSASPAVGTLSVNGSSISQGVVFSPSAGGAAPTGLLGLPGSAGYYVLAGLAVLFVVGVAVGALLLGRKGRAGGAP